MVVLHIFILLVTGWFIAQSDYAAYRWMVGLVATLDAKKLRRNHLAVAVGLILMILTGAVMAFGGRADRLTELLANPAFWVKMSFVAVLVINSFVIGAHLTIPTKKSFASLTSAERWSLYISGAVSTLAWVGALTAAFFLE